MPPIRSPIPGVPKQATPPVPFGLGELGPLNTGVDMTRPDALGYERFRADRVMSDLSRQRGQRMLEQQSRWNAFQRAKDWIRDRDALESGADFGIGDLGPTNSGGYNPNAVMQNYPNFYNPFRQWIMKSFENRT